MKNDQIALQNRMAKDVEARAVSTKMGLEEEYGRRLILYQDEATGEIAALRSKFSEKVEKLKQAIVKLEKERDLMKVLLDDAGLGDEVVLEDTAPVVVDQGDDVLTQSLLTLKEKEIERNISQKYSAMLAAQRENLNSQRQWELARLREELKADADAVIGQMRAELMEKLCAMRTAIDPMTVSPDSIEDLMLATLAIVENHEGQLDAQREKPPSISIGEVESRLSDLNAKLLDLRSENAFLRSTIGQIGDGKAVHNLDDVIRTMRSQVAEQAGKMSEFMEEYTQMRTQLIDANTTLATIQAKEAARELTDASTAAVTNFETFGVASHDVFSWQKEIPEPRAPAEPQAEVILEPPATISRAEIEIQTDPFPPRLSKKPKKEALPRLPPPPQVPDTRESPSQTPVGATQILSAGFTSPESEFDWVVEDWSLDLVAQDPICDFSPALRPASSRRMNSPRPSSPRPSSGRTMSGRGRESDARLHGIPSTPIAPPESHAFAGNELPPELSSISSSDSSISRLESAIQTNLQDLIDMKRRFREENGGMPCVLTIDGQVSIVVPDASPSTTGRPALDTVADREPSQITAPLEPPETHPAPRQRVLSTAAPLVILESAPPSRVLLYSAKSIIDIAPRGSVVLSMTAEAIALEADTQQAFSARWFTSEEEKEQFTPSQRAKIEAKEKQINCQVKRLLALKAAFIDRTELQHSGPGSAHSARCSVQETDDEEENSLEASPRLTGRLRRGGENAADRPPGEPKVYFATENGEKSTEGRLQHRVERIDCGVNTEDCRVTDSGMVSVPINEIAHDSARSVSKSARSVRAVDALGIQPGSARSGRAVGPSGIHSGSARPGLVGEKSDRPNRPPIEDIERPASERTVGSTQRMESSSGNDASVSQDGRSARASEQPLSAKGGKQPISGRPSRQLMKDAPLDDSERLAPTKKATLSLDAVNVLVLELLPVEFATSPVKSVHLAVSVVDPSVSLPEVVIQEIDNWPGESSESVKKSEVPIPKGIDTKAAPAASVATSFAKAPKPFAPQAQQVPQVPQAQQASQPQQALQPPQVSRPPQTEPSVPLEAIAALKARHTQLVINCEDLRGSIGDLTLRHTEIVFVLTKAIQNLMAAFKGKSSESEQVTALVEQTNYLTATIKEQEVLKQDLAEETQTRVAREAELIQTKEALADAHTELSSLSAQYQEMSAQMEVLNLQLTGLKAIPPPAEIEAAADARFEEYARETEGQMAALQVKLDNAELTIQSLRNISIAADLDNPPILAYVPCFTIFDSFAPPSRLPAFSPAGFTRKPIQKVRLTVRSSLHPKLVVPQVSQPRVTTPVLPPPSLPQPSNPPAEQGSMALPGAVFYHRTLMQARKQITRLENQVMLKEHELIELRELYARSQFELKQLQFRAEKGSRALRTTNATADSLRVQLDGAYVLLARRDGELRELRNLLHDISQQTEPVLVKAGINRILVDEANAAALKECRLRTSVATVEKAVQPPQKGKIPEPISPGLERFLARQTQAIERWKVRRNLLLRQQQEHAMGILTGIQLLPEAARPRPARVISIPEPVVAPPKPLSTIVQVTALLPPAWSRTLRERVALGRTVPRVNETSEEYDRAVMRASLPNQELPDPLARGLVGTPL
jgi:hypothetical protein